VKQLSFTFNYSHSIDQLLYHSTRLNIREVDLNRSIGPALIVSARCASGGRGPTWPGWWLHSVAAAGEDEARQQITFRLADVV